MTVPIKLHTAADSATVRFHEVHLADGARIEHRRFCSKEDRPVEYADIGKGYDVDGTRVVFTDDELEALAPARTRTIEIQSFVDLADIDPILFDHPCCLPGRSSMSRQELVGALGRKR